METLQIEIPKGFQIDQVDKKNGKITFKEKPKSVFERIRTINDAITELGENDTEVIQLRKLQNADVADYIIAQQEAIVIVKALNEGYTPNWDDTNETKYIPWFNMSSSGFRFDDYDPWHSDSDVGSRLCFKSRDLAKYAGQQFTDVYKRFMTI